MLGAWLLWLQVCQHCSASLSLTGVSGLCWCLSASMAYTVCKKCVSLLVFFAHGPWQTNKCLKGLISCHTCCEIFIDDKRLLFLCSSFPAALRARTVVLGDSVNWSLCRLRVTLCPLCLMESVWSSSCENDPKKKTFGFRRVHVILPLCWSPPRWFYSLHATPLTFIGTLKAPRGRAQQTGSGHLVISSEGETSQRSVFVFTLSNTRADVSALSRSFIPSPRFHRPTCETFTLKWPERDENSKHTRVWWSERQRGLGSVFPAHDLQPHTVLKRVFPL